MKIKTILTCLLLLMAIPNTSLFVARAFPGVPETVGSVYIGTQSLSS